MEKRALAFGIITNQFCTAWGVFVALLSVQGGINMEWWQTLLIGTVPALCTSIITAVVTLVVSRRSKIAIFTEAIKTLSRQLGLNDDKTLSTDVSDKFNSIIADIGREKGSTLTQQHSDLKEMLKEEIITSEKRYSDEEKRIERFTYEQHNIYETVKQFELFLESWKRLAADNNEQEYKIRQLKEQNLRLEEENKQLKNENEEIDEEEDCEPEM